MSLRIFISEVLQQGVTHVVFWHQQASQISVPVDDHTMHVEDLAFIPVGSTKQITDRDPIRTGVQVDMQKMSIWRAVSAGHVLSISAPRRRLRRCVTGARVISAVRPAI